VVSLNDYALKVVSSSGGVASGSVAYSSLFARTATDGFTLTTNEMPSHSHGVSGGTVAGTSSSSVPATGGTIFPIGATGITINNTGNGASHAHGIDMRVQTAAVVLAMRN
jgi:microcystin-dependent protein